VSSVLQNPISTTVKEFSMNKTIIIGRLCRDPKSVNDNVTKFTLRNTTIRDGVEEAQYHAVVAFGRQATLCLEYLHKGDLCCVEGRLDTYKYEVKGEIRYRQSIIAEHITFLTHKH